MFLVGLTGGIAAGKSTVSALWEQLGAEIIDADILAREVVEPGSVGLTRLVALYGDSILTVEGSLDRALLAKIIFDNPQDRKKVEDILHPLIQERSRELIAKATKKIVVYVIPLLVESSSNLPFDYVVTVEAPVKDQIERLMQNRGLTRHEAESRIASQVNAAHRANRSDAILNSNQSIDLLRHDATMLFWKIEELASR